MHTHKKSGFSGAGKPLNHGIIFDIMVIDRKEFFHG
jgi:hypothetical protein